jgi:hypothetical protein
MSDIQKPQAMDEELSVEELDEVAGGVVAEPTINENCGGNCGCSAAT